MPAKKRSRRFSFPFRALVLAVCVLPGTSAFGVTMWQAGTGDWSHGPGWSPWSLGEPAGGNTNTKQAQINNGGTAVISSLGENCELLALAYNGAGSAGHVIMNGGSLSVSGYEFIGDEGTGSFHQSAGTHYAYRISMGRVSPNASYVMTGGTLSASSLSVGQDGSASFSHSDGQVTASDTVTIRAGAGRTSTYDLSGTGVLKTQSLNVGPGGTGIFTQTGGSVEVTYTASIGNGLGLLGAYNLEDGSLTTYDLKLGRSDGHRGELNITDPSAEIRVQRRFTLYEGASLTAPPGTKIHMGGGGTGAWFYNNSQDVSALADLRNVTLVYGGEEYEGDKLEIAGADLGPTVEGYEGGFELAGLVVGGSISNLTLTDAYDNQPGSSNEALYVRNLYVGPGSSLDLDGHKLYYMTKTIDPTATIIDGGGLIHSDVPEPMTLVLLAIGGALLGRRRRRGSSGA